MKVHSLANGHVIFKEKVHDTTYYLSNGWEDTNVEELKGKLNKEMRYTGIFHDEQKLRLAHLGFRRTQYKYRPGGNIHSETYSNGSGDVEIDVEDGKNVTFSHKLALDFETLQSLVEILEEV